MKKGGPESPPLLEPLLLSLELKAQRRLDDSGSLVQVDRSDRGTDLSEGRAVDVALRIREVHGVEQVEERSAELQDQTLVDPGVLGDREVQVEELRTREEKRRENADLSRARVSEGFPGE